MLLKNIPILRIFDVAKAKEFYIDWLGFKIDFEHQFEENTPYYIGISRDDVQLHLSEHHGDATPGSKVFIICNDIKKFHEELQSRPYKYYRPALVETFYGSWEIAVQDPFGNRLSFNEYKKEE
ncbi:MAG TPA: glyoxalase superfamily protein [Chitinophagaceae bacterium]|nr:glyoxalase superfamily protein [Chitinophagaceae bacterium]